MKRFDYIIAGGGCSGRSLAVYMLPYLKAFGKKVLIVDKAVKKGNDKTWCFWESRPGIFEPVVYRKWDQLTFCGMKGSKALNIQPYHYKMIRSGDFYEYSDKLLSLSDHVTCMQASVERVYTEGERACAVIEGETFSADYIFSSIPAPVEKKPARYQYLLQHFSGLVIETGANTFDPDSAVLMDFNTSQEAGTSFFYVLPFTPQRALVEYTVFSQEVLPEASYKAALDKYIREQLHCKFYAIAAEENGVIPMTDHPSKREDGRIIYIGTAGGYTKASTGYTFNFIQKHARAIVEQLVTRGHPNVPVTTAARFNIYDGILLSLLNSGRLSGEQIFTTMFEKNSAVQILKFLDNETSLREELQIFKTLQKKAFLLAFLRRMLK